MLDIELQEELKKRGFYSGALDGIFGPLSWKALDAFLGRSELFSTQLRWPAKRKSVAAKQLICKELGFEVGKIDGFLGPQTQYAFECYARTRAGFAAYDERTEAEEPKHDDMVLDAARRWPRQRDIESFFGAPGAHLGKLTPPYPLRLSWNLDHVVKTVAIHEKCLDSASRVLTRVLEAYGQTQISELRLDRFGGCYAPRNKRGGKTLSTHAYGIALDFDPERNQWKWGRDKAVFARPEYEVWWRLWEEEGWLSLGRARDFDWMHVQAARL